MPIHQKTPPDLSIIVPIYNVELYLDECLRSLQSQRLDNFEVLMVDDGSTDGSAEIARAWAATDHRFRLIQQPNQGLGAARNTGIAAAAGRYIAFVDSDDRADVDAFKTMVATLDRTGSDMATGNVRRFNSSGSWQAPIAEGIFGKERLQTHVSEYRELLRDLLACNKVIRRDFWERHHLRFPVGVFYEDLPTIIPAHLKASKVDVVTATACLWRVREAGDSSITQSRYLDSKHTLDRVAAVSAVSDLIGTWPDPTLKRDYDAQALERDIRYFVDVLPYVDDEYRGDAIPAITNFVRSVSAESMSRVSARHRIKYYLLSEGRIDHLTHYIEYVRDGRLRGDAPLRRRRSVHLDPTPLRGMRLPRTVTDMTAELSAVCRLDDIEVRGTTAHLRGWAYIDGLSAPRRGSQRIELALVQDGRRIAIDHTTTFRPDATRVAAQEENCYDWAGFEAMVPLGRLVQSGSAGDYGTWRLEVRVRNGRFAASTASPAPRPGRAQRTWLVHLGRDIEARLYWTRNNAELAVQLRRRQPRLEGLELQDDFLHLTVEAPESYQGGQLSLRDRAADTTHQVPLSSRGSRHIVRVPVHELTAAEEDDVQAAAAREFELRVESPGGERSRRLIQDAQVYVARIPSLHRELAARRNRYGDSRLLVRPATPYLVHAQLDGDGRLHVTIDYPEAAVDPHLVLSAEGRSEQHLQPLQRTTKGYEAAISLAERDSFGSTLPMRSGVWTLWLRNGDEDLRVEVTSTALGALPLQQTVRGRTYRLTDRHWHTPILHVLPEPPLPTGRGRYDQHFLRHAHYPKLRTSPLRPLALYESYWGREFSDSPAVLQREISRRALLHSHLAVVNDAQCTPDGSIQVVAAGSRPYYDALATGRLIVNNTHLPDYFERRPGQIVLQTWHGVGLKSIGLDIAEVHFRNREYRERILRESSQWTYLISPSPFASPILRRAFNYEGALLETGAPRNDLFYDPAREQLALAIRRRLGVSPSQRIILYAPTWRDDVSDAAGKYRLDLHLDLLDLATRLGPDYAVLFRKHPNIVDSLPAATSRKVIDVSGYPEVNELLLVCDILVTDYSTLMFDFANTGRPMIFYTYDLDHYRDTLRGFYFDFEAEAPGPLVSQESEITELILSAESWAASYQERYEAFMRRFCPWDDGHAAERVVDVIQDALESQ